MNKKILLFVLVGFFIVKAVVYSFENIQIILYSDKKSYTIKEPIYLHYEVTWLGQEDANIYFNALSLPELEILYLNREPLLLKDFSKTNIRSKPGRHEIRTFAPTMSGESYNFPINSPKEPVSFFNEKKGYYDFDKRGTYVIRAKFDIKSPWKLSDKQEKTIWSSALIIKIGN